MFLLHQKPSPLYTSEHIFDFWNISVKWFKRILIAIFSLTLLGIGTIVAAYYYVLPDLPDVNSLKTVKLQTPLRIYSNDGLLISQFGEKRRVPIEYQDVPEQLINAVLDTEDARFFEHKGIDPIGIVRAAIILVTTGKKAKVQVPSLNKSLAAFSFHVKKPIFVKQKKSF